MGHGARWTVVVLATLGAFGLPWITLTLAGAGADATLALASTVSAAVLSAGGGMPPVTHGSRRRNRAPRCRTDLW